MQSYRDALHTHQLSSVHLNGWRSLPALYLKRILPQIGHTSGLILQLYNYLCLPLWLGHNIRLSDLGDKEYGMNITLSLSGTPQQVQFIK